MALAGQASLQGSGGGFDAGLQSAQMYFKDLRGSSLTIATMSS